MESPEAVAVVQFELLVVMVAPPSPPSLLAVHPASNTVPKINRFPSHPEAAEDRCLGGWILPLSERSMARGMTQF